MKEVRRVMLTLKLYAEVIVLATNDEDAERMVSEIDMIEYLEPKYGLQVNDVIAEIDGFEQEFIDG